MKSSAKSIKRNAMRKKEKKRSSYDNKNCLNVILARLNQITEL